MKNNQNLTISDSVISKITYKTINLINFIQKLSRTPDLISDAPTRKIDDFIDRNRDFYKQFISDFNQYCPDDNMISNTIALNKMNAICLYFNLMNLVLDEGEDERGVYLLLLRAINEYLYEINIPRKWLEPSWLQNQFTATFDNFDHIIADIYLLYDLLRFFKLYRRGLFELDINKKINFESLYDNCDHKWLLNFTINKSNELSARDVRGITRVKDYITYWITELSQRINSKDTSFFLAWGYLNYINNSDRQLIIFNAIKNNISTTKNKEKNKSVSISIQDHEKLQKIADKVAGGKIKIALSMIIEQQHSTLFNKN